MYPERLWNTVHGMKAALIMVVVQAAFAGVNVLYKLAVNDGMNLTIAVAYRFLFASAFMVPLALVVESKNRPKMTWRVLVQAFFCGLFGGSMGQNLYLESLALTSATYASAMANLLPGITFILTLSFGMEKLRVGTTDGKAKVVGTMMGIGGAMLLTFYKGMEINIWSSHVDLLHRASLSSAAASPGASGLPPVDHRALGSLLAVSSCFCYAVWLIIQARMIESYPCHYTTTALMTVMGSLQAVAYALLRERDWEQWKLGWNIRLLTVSYCGIVGSGLSVTLITWCVRMRGPLFVSVFNPLMLVMVVMVGSMVLDEKLHLGSILGAGLIVCGLYVVLWGKGKEMKRKNRLVPAIHSGDLKDGSIEIIVTGPENDQKDKSDKTNNPGNNISMVLLGDKVVLESSGEKQPVEEQSQDKERRLSRTTLTDEEHDRN